MVIVVHTCYDVGKAGRISSVDHDFKIPQLPEYAVTTSQLQGTWFSPELRLSPHVCLGFLLVL